MSSGEHLAGDGGVMRALWKRIRATYRMVAAFCAGRVLRYGRHEVSRFVQAHTGKGGLGV